MATSITDVCINCGVCESECPNQAIFEGPLRFEIDPARCTECVGFHDEEQCAAVCPVNCCIPDPERAETEAQLFERAVALHPEQAGYFELTAGTSRFRARRRAAGAV